MNPRNNVLHREGYDRVARIETPNDRTVVVHLRRRYPPFVTQFFITLQEGAKPVVPRHLLSALADVNHAQYNARPISTGPFRFVAWERGRRILLEANATYFKGRPRLDRIELSILPDMNTVETQLPGRMRSTCRSLRTRSSTTAFATPRDTTRRSPTGTPSCC